MYKIIGADQREYGPVTEEELRRWFAEGRANRNTLAQREGETGWKPLWSFPEFTDVAAGATQPFASQGASRKVDGILDITQLTTEILARPLRVNVGGCISRSWDLVKTHFGLTVGATFLVILVMILIPLIPCCIGSILQWVLNGVLVGGLYWFFLKLIRGEETRIGDAFAGFNISTLQLILAGMVISILIAIAICIVGLPFLTPFFLSCVRLASRGQHPSEADLQMLLSLGVSGAVGILLSVVVAIFFGVIWMFTLPLVIDKKLNFWDAMELSRKVVMKIWFQLFVLLLVNILIAFVGALACGVGLFVAIPIIRGAGAYAYEDIFGLSVSKTP